MQFKEVVKEISNVTGEKPGKVEEILRAYSEFVKTCIVKENEIPFVGLGKFKMKESASRKCMNLTTNEPMIVPACKKPVFIISPTVKKDLKVVI